MRSTKVVPATSERFPMTWINYTITIPFNSRKSVPFGTVWLDLCKIYNIAQVGYVDFVQVLWSDQEYTTLFRLSCSHEIGPKMLAYVYGRINRRYVWSG